MQWHPPVLSVININYFLKVSNQISQSFRKIV